MTVVEQMDRINDGGNFLHMLGLNAEIKKSGLKIEFNTIVKEINASGIVCEADNKTKTLSADSVIYATGQTALRNKALSLQFSAPEFYMIGDCISPRNIMYATSEAFTVARSLGRL